MEKKPTDELNDLLVDMRPDQLKHYFKDNEKYLADEKKAFYYYMKDVLDEKDIKLKDVYSFAGVTESYGSKILTMEKHTKNRDLIIRDQFVIPAVIQQNDNLENFIHIL